MRTPRPLVPRPSTAASSALGSPTPRAPRHQSIDVWCYAVALHLYPPAFRRAFGAQMAGDFAATREDAERAAGRRGLWAFWAHVGADLASSLVQTWWRTGWPAIAVLSMIGPLVSVATLVNVWGRLTFTLPGETRELDLLGVELVTVTVLLVMVATILVTLTFAGPRRSRLARPMRSHRRRL